MMLPLLASMVMAAATAPAAAPPAQAYPTPVVNGQALPKPAVNPKVENSCGVMTAAADPKAPAVYTVSPGFRVLQGPQRLTMPKADGNVVAIQCRRDTVVPGDGDGRVLLLLAKPFVLSDGARQGVLQMKDNKYSFRMIKGDLSDAEKTAIGQRLNIMQANFEGLKAAAAAKAKAAPTPGAKK